MTARSRNKRYWERRFRTLWASAEGKGGRNGETSRRSAFAPTATGAAVEPAAQV